MQEHRAASCLPWHVRPASGQGQADPLGWPFFGLRSLEDVFPMDLPSLLRCTGSAGQQWMGVKVSRPRFELQGRMLLQQKLAKEDKN